MQTERIRPIYIQEFQQCLVEDCSVKNKDGSTRALSQTIILNRYSISYEFFKRAVILEIIEENPVDTIGKIRTERSMVELWTVV